MLNVLLNWLVAAVAVAITAYLLPGVMLAGTGAAFVTALVLGVINAIIRPLIIILTLPINVLTLGLLTFAINAALVLLTSAIVPGFSVTSFWWALLFSLVLSLVNAGLYALGNRGPA